MIFNQFDPNKDIVSGRTTRVASGFWPEGLTAWTQSGVNLLSDFWSLTGSVGTPSFGTSVYDVRRTMYYLNVFPGSDNFPTNPYFSIAYGNINGDIGSGSFALETGSIQTSPTKAVYSQYKNMLLGSYDLDGMFTMISASTTINATDIWVIDFSAYKMKDRVDEGLLEFSLTGPLGQFTFIDDSPYTLKNQLVYEIIGGSLSNVPATPTYEGLGLFYPSNGIVILNAAAVAKKLGMTNVTTQGVGSGCTFTSNGSWVYNPSNETRCNYTYNHYTLFQSLNASAATMKIRKSEYVPARHYFIRVTNKDFNYSNNPTYIYDGTDGIAGHERGKIRNSDFINDPKTYITTVGLYNDSNELVAVAKLSRPAIKSFSSEILLRVKLDF